MKTAHKAKPRSAKSLKRFAAITAGIMLACAYVPAAQAYYVDSGKVYNDQGQMIHIRGVNWFGFETTTHAPHGLWARNVNSMIDQMKSIGINAVRIPLAPNAIHGSPVSGIDFGINPELANKNSLQVLDYIVNALNKAGMYVLLDHHRPNDYAISELWYTQDYSEQQWLDDLKFLANRYKNVPYFLGMDLKNEPHGSATWGSGNQATDWNSAAERASRVVLAADPKALVFVEGIQDRSSCSGPYAAGWGGNLAPIQCTPLNIPQNKLVLSPHVYGPDVYMYDYFNAPDYPNNMPAIWNQNFGFAKDLGYTVIPTEFGSTYGHDGLVKEKVWFDAFIAWLKQKGITDSFYWSWNPNSSDTGGLLKDDWKTVWSDKLAKLDELWGLPVGYKTDTGTNGDGSTGSTDSSGSTGTTDSSGSTGSSSPVELTLAPQLDKTSDWGTGYCMDATVTNTTSQAVQWRSLIPRDGSITQIWGATATVTSPIQLTAQGENWNAILLPNQSTHFGYCAARSTSGTSSSTTTPIVTLQPKLTKTSDWGTGYCMSVEVQNTTGEEINWRTVLPADGIISSSWDANISIQDNNHMTAQGVSWNEILKPGTKADFGYCANR